MLTLHVDHNGGYTFITATVTDVNGRSVKWTETVEGGATLYGAKHDAIRNAREALLTIQEA